MSDENSEFTCASCHEAFEKAWSDEEAQAEYAEVFPDEKQARFPVEEICDECYEKFMAWLPTAQFPEHG